MDDGERVPNLLSAAFKGPILCSEPTGNPLPIVLEEAFKLSFGRDQKQIERYIKLIEKCIIALPCRLASPCTTRKAGSTTTSSLSWIAKRCNVWGTETARPVIVIAGNGMCSSGRIVNYLKSMPRELRHYVPS
ncbi:hypothetical protein D9M69_616320 [compost metagenome]